MAPEPGRDDFRIIHDQHITWIQQGGEILHLMMSVGPASAGDEQQPSLIPGVDGMIGNQGGIEGKIELGELHEVGCPVNSDPPHPNPLPHWA